MAKRKSRPRRPRPHVPPTAAGTETRAAEAATVAWMLATLATLVAEFIALVGWVVLTLLPGADRAPRPVLALPPLMLCIACLTGLLALILQAVVGKTRTERPPRAITAAAFVIGILPLALIVIFWVGGGR